jgi:hypothetical protein
VNAKLRRQCRQRKRRLLRRIDKHRGQFRTPSEPVARLKPRADASAGIFDQPTLD